MPAWEDATIAGAQFVFVIALLPAIAKRQAPPISTCAWTAAGLGAMVPALASLELAWSMTTTFCAAALWLVMLVQQIAASNARRRLERP